MSCKGVMKADTNLVFWQTIGLWPIIFPVDMVVSNDELVMICVNNAVTFFH